MSIPAKKNVELRQCIKRARANLRTCIAQNEKRIIYPELFSQTSAPPPSPLHWNSDKFSKRDLIELLTALENANVIIDEVGKPIPFTHIVEQFSHLLNVPISSKYAFKERDYILNIKYRTTAFLDQISASLLKKDVKRPR